MKKKILTVVIILASIGLLIALFTLPTYLKNKKEEEREIMFVRGRDLELLGFNEETLVEGKPLREVLNNEKEKKILLNDHVTATISEENFSTVYFKIFAWHMSYDGEWDYEAVRESLEKEFAMLADKEHGIAVLYDKETQLGGYRDWVINEGADERVLIKEVGEAIKDLISTNSAKNQDTSQKLGVSLEEFGEIIKNYKQYPEYWEALYRLAEQEAEE